tara:strand:- start:1257 stop:1439 length:183 start_codon:yes stop_codon:yes gene_type:complete
MDTNKPKSTMDTLEVYNLVYNILDSSKGKNYKLSRLQDLLARKFKQDMGLTIGAYKNANK